MGSFMQAPLPLHPAQTDLPAPAGFRWFQAYRLLPGRAGQRVVGCVAAREVPVRVWLRQVGHHPPPTFLQSSPGPLPTAPPPTWC